MRKPAAHHLRLQLLVAWCLACSSVTALAVVLLQPERWITASVERLSTSASRIIPDEVVSNVPRSFDRSHVRFSGTLADGQPLSGDVREGDHITIGGKDGLKRVFAVTDVDRHEIPMGPRSAPRPLAILVVTARDLDRPQSQPIRFIIEDRNARGVASVMERSPRAL
ncbi:MAG: hypothetical protein AAGC70_19810 [Pseudomonadota bacterium]